MKKNDYSYFENRDCEYFPCHKGAGEYFNCMFCYCPLYALGDGCGGNFSFTDQGVKDCSACLVPHGKNGADYVAKMVRGVSEIAAKNRKK